jgi:hypothetical protein
VRREASDRAYPQAVLGLVGRGKLSAAYGAKLFGTNRVDFVACMRQHCLPLADYPAQVLHQDIADTAQDFIGGKTNKG